MLGSGCTIEIELDGIEQRQKVDVTTLDGKQETLPLYIGNEAVSGTIKINLDKGVQKVEHQGIKVALLGVISKWQLLRFVLGIMGIFAKNKWKKKNIRGTKWLSSRIPNPNEGSRKRRHN